MLNTHSEHPEDVMTTNRWRTMSAIGWFFLLFNVERIYEPINIASFVYVLSACGGLAMLFSRRLRQRHLATSYAAALLVMVIGKAQLGYAVTLYSLPFTLLEAFAIGMSIFLCKRIGESTDQFSHASQQLVDAMLGHSIPEMNEAEPLLLEEIRRARRHERPLSFLILKASQPSHELAEHLYEELRSRLENEYALGCISKLITNETKSHDIAVRCDDKILLMLPETNPKQAMSLMARLKSHASQQMKVRVEAETFAFGADELTLTGILDQLKSAQPSPSLQTSAPPSTDSTSATSSMQTTTAV